MSSTAKLFPSCSWQSLVCLDREPLMLCVFVLHCSVLLLVGFLHFYLFIFLITHPGILKSKKDSSSTQAHSMI